jgi:recombination protein RecA
LDLGVQLGIIEKRGSFYLYKEDRLAQGREAAKQALRENPALCLEIENAIRRASGLAEVRPAAADGS